MRPGHMGIQTYSLSANTSVWTRTNMASGSCWTDTRTGMQELFTSKVFVQTSLSEFDPRVDSDTVFVPLHGSAGGVLINLKTGEVIPLPYPQLNPELRTRSQINTIRNARMQQISMLLEAFAIVEESISNAGAEELRWKILSKAFS